MTKFAEVLSLDNEQLDIVMGEQTWSFHNYIVTAVNITAENPQDVVSNLMGTQFIQPLKQEVEAEIVVKALDVSYDNKQSDIYAKVLQKTTSEQLLKELYNKTKER